MSYDTVARVEKTHADCMDAVKKQRDQRDQRGSILLEAMEVINGERQDQYGNPEDSFETIAGFWNVYIKAKVMNEMAKRGIKGEYLADLDGKDVALLMSLFKTAREINQHKRDNLRDGAGYLGIASDM